MKRWSPDEVSDADFVSVEEQAAAEQLADAVLGYVDSSALHPLTGVIRISGVPNLISRTHSPFGGLLGSAYVQGIEDVSLSTETYPSSVLFALRNACYSLINRLSEAQLRSAAEVLARLLREQSNSKMEDLESEASAASTRATASAISTLLAGSKRIRSLPVGGEFKDVGE